MDIFTCGNWCSVDNYFDNEIKYVTQDYHFIYFKSEERDISNAIFINMDKNNFPQKKIQVKKSNYARHIKKCREKNQKFVDLQFPPNQTSLGKLKNRDKIQWKRISQIYQNPKFIQGQIQARDIMQGSSGDCYFLSAISSIAQIHHRVEMVLLNQDIVQQGIYCFRLRLKGIPTQVYVDDYIPVKMGKPLFTKPSNNSNEIWVMLLEKVWAKVNTTYQNISGGFPHHVLQAFTFGPCFYMNISNLENQQQIINLRKKMINAQHQNFVMCVGSKSSQNNRKFGIIPEHTYSVLSIIETFDLNNDQIILIKLRNPWGKIQWNGKFSQYDNQNRQIVQSHTGKAYQDGIFIMQFNDFLKFFQCIDICHIKQDYCYFFETIKKSSNKNGVFMLIEVFESGQYYFSVYFQSSYDYKQNKKAYIILCKKQQNQQFDEDYIFIQGKFEGILGSVTLHNNLEKGKYILFIKIQNENLPKEQIVVSSYSKVIPRFKCINKQQTNLFLEKVFYNHAKNNPKKKILSSEYGPQQWIAFEFLVNQGGFGYICGYISEKSKKKILIQAKTEDFIKMGLQLKKPWKNEEKIKLEIRPGHWEIILCKLKNNITFKKQINFPPPINIMHSV